MNIEESGKTCLNCSSPVEGKFCSNCGQPADTERFSLKHVVIHHFVLSLLYYKKGFLFTLKQLATRPGHAVREYIEGKRADHLSPVSLMIVFLVILSLIEHNVHFQLADLSSDKETAGALEELVKEYPKTFYVSVIPIYALLSFVLFRKAHNNYAEHLVINTFRASVNLLFTMLIFILGSMIKNIPTMLTIERVISILSLGYSTWFFYQCFFPAYKNKFTLVLRAFLSTLLPLIVLITGIAIYFALTSGE